MTNTNEVKYRVLLHRDIELGAQKLIDLDNEIWEKKGFRNARNLEDRKEEYYAEIKETIKDKVAQQIVDELEEQNYHSLVEALTELKLIQK